MVLMELVSSYLWDSRMMYPLKANHSWAPVLWLCYLPRWKEHCRCNEVEDLEMGSCAGLPAWPHENTSVLISERQARNQSRCDKRSRSHFLPGAISQGKQVAFKAGKGRKQTPPGDSALTTPGLEPRETYFELLTSKNHKRINVCFFFF